jgi:hypothetical protein
VKAQVVMQVQEVASVHYQLGAGAVLQQAHDLKMAAEAHVWANATWTWTRPSPTAFVKLEAESGVFCQWVGEAWVSFARIRVKSACSTLGGYSSAQQLKEA